MDGQVARGAAERRAGWHRHFSCDGSRVLPYGRHGAMPLSFRRLATGGTQLAMCGRASWSPMRRLTRRRRCAPWCRGGVGAGPHRRGCCSTMAHSRRVPSPTSICSPMAVTRPFYFLTHASLARANTSCTICRTRRGGSRTTRATTRTASRTTRRVTRTTLRGGRVTAIGQECSRRRVVDIQARTHRDRYDAMERPATKVELARHLRAAAAMAAAFEEEHHGTGFPAAEAEVDVPPADLAGSLLELDARPQQQQQKAAATRASASTYSGERRQRRQLGQQAGGAAAASSAPSRFRPAPSAAPMPWLLFPESRQWPLKTSCELPERWANSKPSRSLATRARLNESFSWQVGVFASSAADVKVLSASLVSAAWVLPPAAAPPANEAAASMAASASTSSNALQPHPLLPVTERQQPAASSSSSSSSSSSASSAKATAQQPNKPEEPARLVSFEGGLSSLDFHAYNVHGIGHQGEAVDRQPLVRAGCVPSLVWRAGSGRRAAARAVGHARKQRRREKWR